MKILNRNSVFLILIALITITGCSEDDPGVNLPQGNLLQNANLEMGSSSPDNWWSSELNPNFLVSWSEEDSFSPDRSLSISCDTPTDSIFAFWAQTIALDPSYYGSDMVLTAKVKSDLQGSGISIAIRGDNTITPEGVAQQFASTQYQRKISGEFDWTDQSVRLDDIKSEIRSITVYLIYLAKTEGVVYFDDINLQLE